MSMQRVIGRTLIGICAVFQTSSSVSQAAIVMVAESKTVQSDPASVVSSFFDVYFDVTANNPSLAGYQLRVDLSPASSGITFGAPTSTSNGSPPRTPVFTTTPTDLSSTTSRIQATDFLPSGAEPIADNEGLVRVPFTIAPNATGVFDLLIHPTETALSNAAGGAIAFQPLNGRITVERIFESAWNVDMGGNWSAAANWTLGVPNGIGAKAVFGSIITQARSVSVDTAVTSGQIDFNSSNAYTIAGPNTLTLNVTSGNARINVTSGSHTISAPLMLADSTIVTVGNTASHLSITGPFISSGATLTKAGAGGLTVNHVRATSLAVESGAVIIAPNGGVPGTSAVDTLSVNGTSRFDLNNNDLVVRATAATKDAVHDAIQDDIASAQNGIDANFITKWDGPGITSSFARTSNVATGFDLTGLGVIRNSDIDIITGLPGASYTAFSGQPVTPDDVLVKYTYIGDGNLDGLVGFDDYVGMDNAFFGLIPNLGWATGDINFDGVINFDDYTVVDQAFFFQGAPLSNTQAVPIPEPSTCVLILLGATLLLTARRHLRR